jgi:two-component system, chemotaxis family, response regulator Rcp1
LHPSAVCSTPLSLNRIVEEQSVPFDILPVEDNEGDFRLMHEVLAEIHPTVRPHAVTDGAEAMDFLRAPRPDVILLDLRLPRLHGREVLARVKANPHLPSIPVIVLTSSEKESDVATSDKRTANPSLKKPGNWNDFEEMVKGLNNFWFMQVKLPQPKKRG